jgi:peptide/nickel transport system substrate-binding protein
VRSEGNGLTVIGRVIDSVRTSPGGGRFAFCALLACLLGIGISACGSTGTDTGTAAPATGSFGPNQPFQPEGKPVHGGTLTYARTGPILSLSPWSPNLDVYTDTLIYNQLVEATADPAKLVPGLAESWKISKDHLNYTFQLRPGVHFSNGEELTAEDVKFSLETAADPELDPPYALLFSNLRSVTVESPRTVRLTVTKPTPAMLYNLSVVGGSIVPKDAVESAGLEALAVEPIGTGPFVPSHFSPGSPRTVLVKNPHYWRPKLPYLDAIEFRSLENDTARLLAVQSGSADIAESVPYSQIEQIEGSTDVDLVKQNLFSSDWIQVNDFKAPFNDRRVRQALVYATPREQIADVVFRGAASVAAIANLPTKYLDTSIKPYPYDPQKAKQLLAQAGQSGLNITLDFISGDTVASQVATILQSAYAKAGINLTIQQRDGAALGADMDHANFDLVNLPPNAFTSDVPVDDEWDSYLVHSNIPGNPPGIGWNNPQARKLIERAVSTWDEQKRRKMFAEYQRILSREQPLIALVNLTSLYAVRSDVHNFAAAGTGWPLLAQTWLSE